MYYQKRSWKPCSVRHKCSNVVAPRKHMIIIGMICGQSMYALNASVLSFNVKWNNNDRRNNRIKAFKKKCDDLLFMLISLIWKNHINCDNCDKRIMVLPYGKSLQRRILNLLVDRTVFLALVGFLTIIIVSITWLGEKWIVVSLPAVLCSA